jgi:hypothetical protein
MFHNLKIRNILPQKASGMRVLLFFWLKGNFIFVRQQLLTLKRRNTGKIKFDKMEVRDHCPYQA